VVWGVGVLGFVVWGVGLGVWGLGFGGWGFGVCTGGIDASESSPEAGSSLEPLSSEGGPVAPISNARATSLSDAECGKIPSAIAIFRNCLRLITRASRIPFEEKRRNASTFIPAKALIYCFRFNENCYIIGS